MPHVELYINDELLDLKGDESIEVDYSIFDIKKIDKRGGARSYSFELPKTNRNKSVLENPEVINNLSRTPYTRLKCRCFVDGVDVLIRFAEIESAGQFYNIRLYGSNSDLFNDLSKIKLFDLDLSAYDHIWTIQTMLDSRYNDEGIIYAIISYHEDSPNSFINNDNHSARVDYILPSIYVNTILKQIFAETQYTLINEVEEDTAKMIMPIHFNAVEPSAYIDGKYDGVTRMNAQLTVPVGGSLRTPFTFDFITGNTFGYYNFPYTINGERALRIEDRVYIKMTFSIDVTFASNANFFTIQMNLFDTNGNPIVLVPPLVRDYQNMPAGANNITFDYTILNFFAGIQTPLYIVVFFTNLSDVLGDNQPVFVESTSTITLSDVVYLGNILEYNNFIPVSAVMPDMTQLDFFKNYLFLFNLIPIVDNINNTVTLRKFDTLYSRLSLAYDWSNKLDLTDEAETRYIIDEYAQKNYLKYAEDGDEPIPVDANGLIEIDNKNLELETDLFELDFAATNAQLLLNFSGVGNNIVPQIGVYKEGAWTNDKLPRLLNLSFKTSADIGGSMNYLEFDGTQTAFNDRIPFAYFISLIETFNLGFGNNLIANYYSVLSGLLNRLKITSLPIRLTASDISQIDFTTPVFISKYESYFYISAIKGFSYTESKSTLVELVKLNING